MLQKRPDQNTAEQKVVAVNLHLIFDNFIMWDSPAEDSPVVDSPVVDSPAEDSPVVDSLAVEDSPVETLDWFGSLLRCIYVHTAYFES